MENSIKYAYKFVPSNDTGDIHTFYVWSRNEEIRLGNETDDIVNGLINSFLNNYQKEKEVILYLNVLI